MSYPYQDVYPLQLYEVINYVPIEGAYRYNPKGRFPLLQKLCFLVLSKLRCDDLYPESRMKARSFDSEKLVDVIKETEEIIYQIVHQRARYILVGRDHYERLVKETDYMAYWMFEFPPYYQTNKVRPNTLFRGIRVVFVPWMNGIVALPELGEM